MLQIELCSQRHECLQKLNMVSALLRLTVAVVVLSAGGSLVTAAAVIDLNFVDLAEIVKVHPFLAVAFYSPGCGHCRRLLPSWTQAAELIEDQHLPVRLARMDISGPGGMLAWEAFGLKRVPAVKIFAGNDIDDPLPYTGHLDAGGVAAHLAMLERDWRRRLAHQEKYEARTSSSVRTSSGLREPEEVRVDESGMTLVALSGPSSTTSSSAEEAASPTDKFREAVGRGGLVLVFFVADDSPKTRHMMAELRKVAPRLSESDFPVETALVDLRPRDSSGSSGSSRRRGKGSGSRNPNGPGPGPTGLDMASVKRQFAVDIGLPVGEVGQELRIFLDGRPWVEGGAYRGMLTADGILKHMQWVATEAGLSPQRQPGKAGHGATCNCEGLATAGVSMNDACAAASRAGNCPNMRQ